MKTTAYCLTICAAALAVAALWLYNGEKAHAADVTTTNIYASDTGTDTVAKSTILDNSRYPDIIVKIECSGSDVDDMVSQCAELLRATCPDGGTVKEAGETPVGVIPARVEVVVACRHEPSNS